MLVRQVEYAHFTCFTSAKKPPLMPELLRCRFRAAAKATTQQLGHQQRLFALVKQVMSIFALVKLRCRCCSSSGIELLQVVAFAAAR